MRILVVEDHLDTRDALVRLFTRAGHVIDTAACIAEAQRHCDPCRFELLICDIGLPDGSGWDFMMYVKKTCPRPSIALTGFGTDADIQASEESGYCAHLTKPISFDLLLRTVDSIQRELSSARRLNTASVKR
jgi:two-component system CheB/CheR fusion protein